MKVDIQKGHMIIMIESLHPITSDKEKLEKRNLGYITGKWDEDWEWKNGYLWDLSLEELIELYNSVVVNAIGDGEKFVINAIRED